MTHVLPLINLPSGVHMSDTLLLIWEVPRQRYKTVWPVSFNLWPQLLAENVSQSEGCVYFNGLRLENYLLNFTPNHNTTTWTKNCINFLCLTYAKNRTDWHVVQAKEVNVVITFQLHPHIHASRPCHESHNLSLIFKFDACLSIRAEGRSLWEWSSCKVPINNHGPCRQIYDHGGYKATWDNAASHLYSYKQHRRASLGLVCGHGGGGGDDGDDKEQDK